MDASNQTERRLVFRLLDYWRGICGSRDMPRPGDVVEGDIPDMWDCCFMIDCASESGPVLTSVGSGQQAIYGGDATGAAIADLRADTLMARSTAYVAEVLRRKVPVTYGGEFCDENGRRVLYRSILMPLSDDGTTVTALLGAANCLVAEEVENTAGTGALNETTSRS